MPGIRTNAAAEVLGVSPNTLRSWERRYGYPTPKRTAGKHRNYELVELQALRDAL
ncbi:MAG: MerR family DNA-binding transcriptional regulator, partial [Solirubrobacterales bacterium]